MVQQANLTLANQSCCSSTIHVQSTTLILYEKQLRRFEVERALTHLSLLISVKTEQKEARRRWERAVEEKEGRDVVQIVSLLGRPKTTGHLGDLISS